MIVRIFLLPEAVCEVEGMCECEGFQMFQVHRLSPCNFIAFLCHCTFSLLKVMLQDRMFLLMLNSPQCKLLYSCAILTHVQ